MSRFQPSSTLMTGYLGVKCYLFAASSVLGHRQACAVSLQHIAAPAQKGSDFHSKHPLATGAVPLSHFPTSLSTNRARATRKAASESGQAGAPHYIDSKAHTTAVLDLTQLP